MYANNNGGAVSNLVPIVSDDDSAGFLCSKVTFNAVLRTTYNIQVDGFYGAMGNIMLSWSIAPTNSKLPTITSQPTNQTVALGGTAIFNVGTPGAESDEFQWLKNGVPISGQTISTLTIPNVAVTDVGVYQAQITS